MIHFLRDGQQFGPYSLEEINAFLADGSLLPSDQAWYEGAPEWIPLTEVPGVALLAQPVSSPVATGVETSGGSGKHKELLIGIGKRLLIGIAAGVVVLAGGTFAGMHFLGGKKESEKPVGISESNEQGVGGLDENAPTTSGAMTFSKVEGIFRKYRCMECHNSKESNKVEADLDFSFPTTTRAFTSPNQPGNPATAPLVLAITPGAGRPMPPNGPMISKVEVQQIMDWIAAGAKF